MNSESNQKGVTSQENTIYLILILLEMQVFSYLSFRSPSSKGDTSSISDFSHLQFFIIYYSILQELIDTLTVFRDGLNEIKDEIACCLVTLMSHGEKGFIKMKDGDKVSLEDVFEMFNNKNCPALHEKPKIFIIQACRGGK